MPFEQPSLLKATLSTFPQICSKKTVLRICKHHKYKLKANTNSSQIKYDSTYRHSQNYWSTWLHKYVVKHFCCSFYDSEYVWSFLNNSAINFKNFWIHFRPTFTCIYWPILKKYPKLQKRLQHYYHRRSFHPDFFIHPENSHPSDLSPVFNDTVLPPFCSDTVLPVTTRMYWHSFTTHM